jgi:hypothetical protein
MGQHSTHQKACYKPADYSLYQLARRFHVQSEGYYASGKSTYE